MKKYAQGDFKVKPAISSNGRKGLPMGGRNAYSPVLLLCITWEGHLCTSS